MGTGIDSDDFALETNIDAMLGTQRIGCLDKQCRSLSDGSLKVVQQATVRIGNVLAALEHNDFCIRSQSTETRCSACPARIASNDQYSHDRVLLIAVSYCFVL